MSVTYTTTRTFTITDTVTCSLPVSYESKTGGIQGDFVGQLKGCSDGSAGIYAVAALRDTILVSVEDTDTKSIDPASGGHRSRWSAQWFLDICGHRDLCYATVYRDSSIHVLDLHGNPITEIDVSYHEPYALDVYDGRIYATYSDHTVRVVKCGGELVSTWGEGDNTDFNSPRGIVIYKREVYVVDGSNMRVQVFSLDGLFVRTWDLQQDVPDYIAVYKDEIYVVGREEVCVFDPNGKIRRSWKLSLHASPKSNGQTAWNGGIAFYHDHAYIAYGQDINIYK